MKYSKLKAHLFFPELSIICHSQRSVLWSHDNKLHSLKKRHSLKKTVRHSQKLQQKLLNLEFRIFYYSSFAVRNGVFSEQLLEGVFKSPEKNPLYIYIYIYIYIHIMNKRRADMHHSTVSGG